MSCCLNDWQAHALYNMFFDELRCNNNYLSVKVKLNSVLTSYSTPALLLKNYATDYCIDSSEHLWKNQQLLSSYTV